MSEILFVIGMHRSATSAFAGCAALLGAAKPVQMFDANIYNPKGYFEPKAVVQANDAMLASLQRRWNDCRPLPLPKGTAQAAAQQTFAGALNTAFEPGRLRVLKDPRVSVLTPLWKDAAGQCGARPVFALLLRDPGASAASIVRRDGLSAEAAVALWLRYMLDAERHTRGAARTIVSAEAFITDPVTTLTQTGVALNVTWPLAPETARPQIEAFIDRTLMHASDLDAAPVLGLAREVHSALTLLSHSPEDPDALATLDRLGSTFDAMCDEIHARMVFDQLEHAVRRKWEMENAYKVIQELEQRAIQANAQTEQARAALIAVQADMAAQAEQARAALIAVQADMAAQTEQAKVALTAVQTDLAWARRHPVKTLRDYLKYKVLTTLSKASPPLPGRSARRFALSAAKRDPERSPLD